MLLFYNAIYMDNLDEEYDVTLDYLALRSIAPKPLSFRRTGITNSSTAQYISHEVFTIRSN
jgi:hypothetical protein